MTAVFRFFQKKDKFLDFFATCWYTASCGRSITLEKRDGMDFSPIARCFGITDPIVAQQEIHSGNINRTYVVTVQGADAERRDVFQRINSDVFKKPQEVMENILSVTEHIKKKLLEETGSYDRRVLSFLRTADGRPYYYTSQRHFWRVYEYVDNSHAYDRVQTPSQFYEAGYSFGEFQAWLSDFPAETLHEIIPHFHDTPVRYQDFYAALERDADGRCAEVKEEIDFLLARENECGVLMNGLSNGTLPWRVTHNDTKINNILFDTDTLEAICVIDLDTVMPGTSLFDFGDAVRFGASTAAEDERDLSKVSLDVTLYEQFTRGFLKGANALLQDSEEKLLLQSVKVMTLELAVRFLTDYLNGDLYFKITSPDHNLVRARTQIRLVQDIEAKWDQLCEITDRCRAETV